MPRPFDCRTKPNENTYDVGQGVWARPWEEWTYPELAQLHREHPLVYAQLSADYLRRKRLRGR